MMLRAYLWKEWHDQKWLLLSLVLALPAVNLVGWFFLEPEGKWVSRNPTGVLIPFATALLIVAGVLACDLVSRERVRGRLDFLRRLPGDVKYPFWAKAVVLAAAGILLGVGGISHLLYLDIDFLAHFGVTGTQLFHMVLVLFSMGISLSLWCMAVACWMPRGAMVIPAALLIVGSCWLPFILMWTPSWVLEATGGIYHIINSGLASCFRPYPGSIELVILFVFFLPMSALAGAWISFLGFRRGGGHIRSACLGGIVLILSHLALWGWCSLRSEAWSRVRTHEAEFDIYSAIIGEGGEYAFLNTSGRNTTNRVILNLKTGDWHEVDDVKGEFMILAHTLGEESYLNQPRTYNLSPSRSDCPSCIVQEVVQDHGREDIPCLYKEGGGPVRFWDGRVAERIDELPAFTLLDIPTEKVSQMKRYFRKKHHGYSKYIESCDRWESDYRLREELKGIRDSRYIRDPLWLVAISQETDTALDESSWKWMLYDRQTRKLSRAPCSDYPYRVSEYQVPRDKDAYFKVSSHRDGSSENRRIENMFPGEDHWIVHMEEPGREELRVWHPTRDKYDELPLVSDNWMNIKSLVGGWLVVEDEESYFSYVVHRQSLEVWEMPVKKISSITRTADGSFFLLSRDYDSQSWDYVHFDPESGISRAVTCADEKSADFWSRPLIVGIPDENTAYALHVMQGRGYAHGLVRVDFTEGTYRTIFPANQR